MPPRDVKTRDGRTITVDAPAGASDEELFRLARKQRPMAMAETVSPSTPGLVKPSAGEYLKRGARARSGDIAATVASAAVPGSGLLPFAGRLLAAEGGQEAGDYAAGNPVRPGYGAGSQLLGEGISKGAGTLLSPATYGAFGRRTAKAAAEWLKDKVPAFKNFAADEKGLYDIAHKTGQRAISADFDKALRAITPAARSLEVEMPVRDIRALGLKPIPSAGVIQAPTATSGPAPTMEMGKANAAEVIERVTGLWKKNPGLYRRTTEILDGELSKLNVPEYAEARGAYKLGAGFIEMAEKGKFLYGERFDPVRAMQALDKHGKALFRRGMDEFAGILRGPGAKPVEEVKHNPFVRRIEGALAGGALGYSFGIPHAIGGAGGGLVAGELLPKTTYRNVPLTPLTHFAARLAPTGIAEGAREGARQLGLNEAWPLDINPIEAKRGQ